MNYYAEGDMEGDLEGDMLGEVLGEMLGWDTMGMDTVGRRRRGRRGRGMPRGLMAKPPWRAGQLAPGVQMPREGMEPLPLVPDLNAGTFTATVPNIRFVARPQRPFRGERLLAQVFRSGATATPLAARSDSIFVGTALQQLQTGPINLEFFATTAFGVRLDLIPAEPGIEITIATSLSGVLTAPDFIHVELLLLGRSIGA